MQYSTNLDSYVETLNSEPVALKRVVSVLNDGKFPYNHVLAHTVLCIGTEVARFPLTCSTIFVRLAPLRSVVNMVQL